MGSLQVLEVERRIEASPEAAWDVIADMEGYADLTTAGISKVEVLQGSGEGMLRRCYNEKSEHWTETCSIWEPGRQFRFEVHTDGPDYPYPLEQLHGTWQVEPDGSGSVIRAKFEYRLKYGLAGQVMNVFAARGFRRDCEFLLDQWESKAGSLTAKNNTKRGNPEFRTP